MSKFSELHSNPNYDFIKKEEEIIFKGEFDSYHNDDAGLRFNQEIREYVEPFQLLEKSTMRESVYVKQKVFTSAVVQHPNTKNISSNQTRSALCEQGNITTKVYNLIKHEDTIEDEVSSIKHSVDLQHILWVNVCGEPSNIRECQVGNQQENDLKSIKWEGFEFDTTQANGLLQQNTKCDFTIAENLGEKIFTCELCNYHNSRKSHLLKHARTHTSDKPYKCEICNYSTFKKVHLLYHIRTHTGEKPFKCELCDYCSSVKSTLAKHNRTHISEKRFKCELCVYATAEKSSLVAHMRSHTGDKPFKCEICDYRTSVKCNLLRHIRSHTGEKIFKCGLCYHIAAQKGDLVRHIRSHMGVKPFKCNLCDFCSLRKADLVRHTHTHMGAKPFRCEQCNYSASAKSTLVKHIRTHRRLAIQV